MKRKLIAMTLLAAMLASTACNSGKTPESSTSAAEPAVTTTEATTAAETTAATETTAEETRETGIDVPDTKLGKLAHAMLSAMNLNYAVLDDSDPASYGYLGNVVAKDNKKVGIVDYIRLGGNESTGDGCYGLFVIYEFDTNSKQYKSLKTGSKFTVYIPYCNGKNIISKKTNATVTAINGAYVLAVQSIKRDSNDKRSVQYKPPFTVGKIQEGYEAFVAYDSASGGNTSDSIKKFNDEGIPDTKLGEMANKLISTLGNDFYIYSETNPKSKQYQLDKSAQANNAVGIKDQIGLGYYKYFANDPTASSAQLIVEIHIFEFDTDSKEYKSLAKGKKFNFYYGERENETGKPELREIDGTVAAIKGKYVLFVFAQCSSNNGSYWQEKPPYSIGKAQKVCDAFMALKDT